MIVIEGPDGSGKSELIRELTDTFPDLELQSRHCDTDGPVVPLKEWIEDDLGLSQVLHGTKKGQLYDRYPLISETIYGPIIRGCVEPGFNRVEWLTEAWQWFAAREPLVVFCLPPVSVVKANINTSRQMKGVDEVIDVIYWRYHTTFAWMQAQQNSRVDAVRYDYSAYYSATSLMMLKQMIRLKEDLHGVHPR